MSGRRRGLLGDISWFQLAASVLASVTAAWIASSLGVAGTLIGAALGSAVITLTTALYGRTLDRGRTLLVTTASGTVIQRRVEKGEVAETLEQAAELDSPARRAELLDDEPSSRLPWRTIVVTTVVVLGLALAAITAYELVSQHTLDGGRGTTIGDTFGGERGKPQPSDPATTPPEASDPEPTTTRPPAASTPTPTRPTRPVPTTTASPSPTQPTGTPE